MSMSFLVFFVFVSLPHFFLFFFFNDTATTEIYTLSLHDALPICARRKLSMKLQPHLPVQCDCSPSPSFPSPLLSFYRSEEHTSELQSHLNLVCRLLLEKKNHIHPPSLPLFIFLHSVLVTCHFSVY